MNLVPTPKPVRIRIKSAGEEHNSLQSLCQHFKYSDLLPLIKDGRFSRWLSQISEGDVAEKLKDLQGEDKFGLVRVLFCDDSICDEVTLLSFFYENEVYNNNFWVEFYSLTKDQLQQVYKTKNTIGFRGELAFQLGKSEENHEAKRRYFGDAVKYGVEKAKDYLQALEKGNSSDPSSMLTTRLVDNSRAGYVKKLSYLFQLDSFPSEEDSFKGPYFHYYSFFRYLYDLKHQAEYRIRSFYINSTCYGENYARYPDLRDAFHCITTVLQKHLSEINGEEYKRKVDLLYLPTNLKAMLADSTYIPYDKLIKIIDELVEVFWEYLTIQNVRHKLWSNRN